MENTTDHDINSLVYFYLLETCPKTAETFNKAAKVIQPPPSVCTIQESFNKCSDVPENATLKRSGLSDIISKALQGLYEEGFLSDFDLKVGDTLFPVHKAVLGMRSPVFRAMFSIEMKEKEDNCSVIEDVDEDTLQRMLHFIYLDNVEEDMDLDSASSLYEAADKYALETLQQICSDILASGLCVSNVLHVLKLADMHQDEELKSSAIEVIALNNVEIIGSERWKAFEEDNKQLALDTYRILRLHFKKMEKEILEERLRDDLVRQSSFGSYEIS